MFGSVGKIPNIIFKSSQLKRLIIAHQMRMYINEHNLTELGVAEKYLQYVSFKDESRWVVLACKVDHCIEKDFVLSLHR